MRLYSPILTAILLSISLLPPAWAEVLPQPTYANTFCLFPINESWHVRRPGDREKLRAWVDEMRKVIGPERLYAHLGFAIISEGMERETFALARELGIGLVLQGSAVEHHTQSWGFPALLQDPVKGDRRFAQWFQDGSYYEPGHATDFSFGVRACASRYAKPVYELRKAADTARAKRVAQSFKEFPETVLATSGPIESEMNNGDNRWGDYGPFTIAEFRDYLTHRGIYAPGGPRAGFGYEGGAVFMNDPSPDRAAGPHSTFNQVFGTHFTTWSLRYWDPELFPGRVPLDAVGMPKEGEKGFVAGGFDAPRVWPGEAPPEGILAEGNDHFWDSWAGITEGHPGFREKLLNFWLRDYTLWLAEAGMPRDRIYTHQIPGESYGMGRLSRGASAVWTADTPHGSIGITTYFGAASDTDVFQKIVDRNPNWGIFEYHPHPIGALTAPVNEYLHSLYTCIRFRAHILTPISWTDREKDFVVYTGPFAAAMKEVMAALPDQPYFNRFYVNYTPPPVSDVIKSGSGHRIRLNWSPKIWPRLAWKWTDWREFDHFEVRSAGEKVLVSTRDNQAVVDGAVGLHVVAIKHTLRPQLPRVDGLTGSRGRLHWQEINDFFSDHYKVEILNAPNAPKPLQTLTARQSRIELPSVTGRLVVWCRVAACDGAGGRGPWSKVVQVSLPRPGRRLVNLQALPEAFSNSPDTAWRDIAVGGVEQPGLFQHPPPVDKGWSRAEFRFRLPATAPGQKILFVAETGLKDGSSVSDGVLFRVEVNGENRFERLTLPGTPWQPMEVDLTGDAGKDVVLALMTNAHINSAADWATWGDPQLLLTGKGVVERPMVTGIVANGKNGQGKVTLRWEGKASDGSLWANTPGFVGFRVYRGADRLFAISSGRRLGETRVPYFVDSNFTGRETFYRVTAYFKDGTESPPSEAIQYAP